MKQTTLAYILILSIFGGMPITVLSADDDNQYIVGRGNSLPAGEERIVNKIASDFNDFAGTDSQRLVEELRYGNDLQYQIDKEQVVTNDSGEPVMVEAHDENGKPIINERGTPLMQQKTETVTEMVVAENKATMGFGEVTLTLGLAQSLLGNDASYAEIVDTLHGAGSDPGILAKRDAGMGWGEIYQSYGQNLGEVMKGVKSPQFIDMAKIERRSRARAAVSIDTQATDSVHRDAGTNSAGMPAQRQTRQVDLPEQLKKPDAQRPEQSEKPDMNAAGQPEKIDKAVIERPEDTAKPELSRPETAENPVVTAPQKLERPETIERVDLPEPVEKPARPEKPEKPERPGQG